MLNADANADHHYKRDGDIEEYMTLSAKEYNYLSELNKSIPFAIIGSNSIVGDPQNEIVRNTKWGSIQIEDKNICDFKILKNIIFETHLQEFKDVTVEKIYEKFRVEQLIKIETPPHQASNMFPFLYNLYIINSIVHIILYYIIL